MDLDRTHVDLDRTQGIGTTIGFLLMPGDESHWNADGIAFLGRDGPVWRVQYVSNMGEKRKK